ncbi:variable large family protein (plasmid) [Borreliella valaisiana]|nr:variable large family protein [Borreliella valaisiana]
MKGIVEAAEKAGEEGKLNVAAATGKDNADADAGKLFAKKQDNAGGGAAADAGKAAAAVSAVSGEQILKAIVEAAKDGKDKKGVTDVKDAKNPIEAAIGSTDAGQNADEFTKMKKDDQIAAAMVLRGMAQGRQFALTNAEYDDHKGTVKNAVESAIKEISGWLEEMAKAAAVAAGAAGSGEEAIGNVIKATGAKAAEGGEAASVNGIASGIKGIVEAAERAGEEGKLNAAAAAGKGNENAGKLFAKKQDNNAQGGGDAADAGKAAAAVSAVSGEQILKAIVDAAKGGDKKGVDDVKEATNPIDAAIGSKEQQKNADAFDKDGMKKDDQIAAAMVLRGMAQGGQFALKDAHADHKGTVKNAVESAIKEINGWLEEMAKAAAVAAKAATGGGEAIGDVIQAAGATATEGGEATSVNGIASGIKGIVEAAEKADAKEGKLNVADAKEGNADAGKLFATKKDDEGGEAADAGKAAAAVSAVSGEQILKAIVEAAKDGGNKAGVADVKNAAAMVLRGMAQGGQFALQNGQYDAHKGTVKNAVESTIKEINGWLEEMAKAAAVAAGAAGSGEKAIGDVIQADGATAATGGDATSVNGIASGIKGIVDAAEKAGEEGKLNVAAAGKDNANADAGKLFAKKQDAGAQGGGDAADAGKAAAAVSAVSGEQILKAIVDAAKGGEEKTGVNDVKNAENPIDAAIGSTEGQNADAFNKGEMKKDDQIAAAMVLRGMAKGGQFALTNDHDAHKGTVKNAVESANAAAAASAASGDDEKRLGMLFRLMLQKQKVVKRRVLMGLLVG